MAITGVSLSGNGMQGKPLDEPVRLTVGMFDTPVPPLDIFPLFSMQ
jgi:hypothetical protein